MILDSDPDALPHMFLRGFRAPPGGTAETDPVAEEVGVFVARQVIGFDGLPRDPGDEVLSEDLPFAPPDKPAGPFRYEAELATAKPELDVVVVDDLANFMSNAEINADDAADIVVTRAFGDVRIDRGAGFGAPIARNYGWRPRGSAPRLDLAGRRATPADPPPPPPEWLDEFDAKQFDLPAKYFNEFNAGNPVPGELPLSPGHWLRFEYPGPPTTDVKIPAAPSLTVTQDGAPLDPPLSLVPKVDTVVFDKAATSVTLVWRATFPWEDRYEAATLKVA